MSARWAALAKPSFHRLRLAGGDAGRTHPHGPWAGGVAHSQSTHKYYRKHQKSACPPSLPARSLVCPGSYGGTWVSQAGTEPENQAVALSGSLGLCLIGPQNVLCARGSHHVEDPDPGLPGVSSSSSVMENQSVSQAAATLSHLPPNNPHLSSWSSCQPHTDQF